MHEEGGLEISTSCDDHRQETNVNRYRVVQSRDLSGHYGNDGKKLPRRNPVGLQHPLFGDWKRLSMGSYILFGGKISLYRSYSLSGYRPKDTLIVRENKPTSWCLYLCAANWSNQANITNSQHIIWRRIKRKGERTDGIGSTSKSNVYFTTLFHCECWSSTRCWTFLGEIWIRRKGCGQSNGDGPEN
jgi:hypothetical protein